MTAEKSKKKRPSDFNDLHLIAGLDVVKAQLESALTDRQRSFDRGIEQSQPSDDGPPVESYQDDEPVGDWKAELLRTKSGDLKACQRNVTLILDNDSRWDGVLWYSDFIYDIEKRKPPPIRYGQRGVWEDGDTVATRDWLAQHYKFEPKDDDIVKAVLLVAKARRYHPVKRYLEKCAALWDGKRRLSLAAQRYFGAKAEPGSDKEKYLQLAIPKWMVAGVARAHAFKSHNKSGLVDFRNVLILEGAQRAGKSTALRMLGDPWFSDSHMDLNNKDGQQFVRGVWIIEVPELSSFNKSDHNKAKQFLSLAEDRYRTSYGKTVVDWPRQCIISASTNDQEYLKDPTGNERYWPLEVGHIDLDAIKADRHQLWGEAYHLWKENPKLYWVTKEEMPLFRAEQDKRFQADPWDPLVTDYLFGLLKGVPDEMLSEVFVTVPDILKSSEINMDAAHYSQQTGQRIGAIVRRLGWRPRQRGSRASRKYGYIPPPRGDL